MISRNSFIWEPSTATERHHEESCGTRYSASQYSRDRFDRRELEAAEVGGESVFRILSRARTRGLDGYHPNCLGARFGQHRSCGAMKRFPLPLEAGEGNLLP